MRTRLKLTAPLPREYDEQHTLFRKLEWREKQYPELRWVFATMNGMVIGPRQAMQAKRAGMKRGVPDIVIPIRREPHGGMYVELKRLHGKASDEQIAYLTFLRSQNYHAVICRGADEAERAILKYLTGEVSNNG